MVPKPVLRDRRALTFLCAAGVLLLAAVPVQVTGKGIDLYVMLCAGVALLVVERTVGDWVADLLGPAGTALAFAIVAAGGVAGLLSDRGQKGAQRFMAVAEEHGYRPAYFKTERDHEADKARADTSAQIADPSERLARSQPEQPSATPSSSSASAIPADGTASTPQTPASSGWTLFPYRRGTADHATGRLTTEPDLAQSGDEVTLRFRIVGITSKPPSSVSFYANGILLGRVPLAANGTAEARWRPRVPGQYQLRAETSASSLVQTSFSAAVQVLPRGR